MNYKKLPLCLAFMLSFSVTSVWAEEAAEGAEKEIPTEVSEPPYQIGDLPMEQGYYIERGEEATKINFRIVNNQMRVYWIDSDGLIAEPEAVSGNVRFTTASSGRTFYGLTPLSGDFGMGSPANLPPPHIFNLILTLDNSGQITTHNFRYTANLDEAVLPEGASFPE